MNPTPNHEWNSDRISTICVAARWLREAGFARFLRLEAEKNGGVEVTCIAGENHRSNHKIFVQSNQIIFLNDCNQITHFFL